MVTVILLARVWKIWLKNWMMDVDTQRLRHKLRNNAFIGAVKLAGLKKLLTIERGKFQGFHKNIPLCFVQLW